MSEECWGERLGKLEVERREAGSNVKMKGRETKEVSSTSLFFPRREQSVKILTDLDSSMLLNRSTIPSTPSYLVHPSWSTSLLLV